ncbi:heavy metal-binding domain-containing protein [Hymenobacter algoricola]|uniref:Heavy metal binding domain-containing protein n=1 Tax=Hymenobacter algoricola TaxID=486267 RepID=A0ABP7NB12_9BACT
MKGKTLFAATLLLAGSLLGACGSKSAETAAPPAPAAKAAAAVYECPMRCAGSTSAKPGTCPVCGMKLEKKS